jgi:HK97 family phage prohead protease
MSKKRTFILSDGSRRNAKGFRIALSGMNLERFSSNPVMLYGHDSDSVVGRWENLRVEGERLLAEPVFDLEDDTGKKVAGKVDRGFLKGCSIGIIIQEMQETAKGDIVTKSELLEASIVAIPADAGAVILYNENCEQLTFEDIKLKFTNINSQKPIPMDEKEKQALEQQLVDRDKRIATLEAELAQQKKSAVTACLDGAVQAGKITQEEKAAYEKLAAADFETVKNLIDSRASKPSKSLAELAAEARAAAPSGRESWTYLQWMKEDPRGLQQLKLDNPKEFERLQQTLKK